MRAPGWLTATIVGWVAMGPAAADPKPKPTEIDPKPFKDHLEVLQDAHGGTYVVVHDDSPRVFYGPAKQLFEQQITGRSAAADTGMWSFITWAPQLPPQDRASLNHKPDGTYERLCAGLDDAGLTLVTGDKAKTVLAGVKLLPAPFDRRPFLLARDDAGVYYYVDHVKGGEDYHVYVGKKGEMKAAALADVAVDTGGAVFATKSGDLRLVTSTGEASKPNVKWIHGDKNVELHYLDLDMNEPLIYRGLRVYGALGTLCDNI